MNYAFGNGVIVLFHNDQDVTVNESHPFFGQVAQCIADDDMETAWELANKTPEKLVTERYSDQGCVFCEDTEQVYFKGERLNSFLADKIIEHAKKGLPFDNLLKFMERLDANPSRHSREQLFKFLESQHMPITEDGCFLGYKSVRPNFKDWHSGKFDNSVGQVVSMERRDVDDDHTRDCSWGIHLGAHKYAKNFHGGQNIVMVKVDPADAVAVPKHDCTKMRVCRYEVVSVCEQFLDGEVYRTNEDGQLEKIQEEQWADDDFSYNWSEDMFWSDDEDDDWE